MPLIKNLCICACSVIILSPAFSQSSDTTNRKEVSSRSFNNHLLKSNKRFPVTGFIFPTLAIAYGFSTLDSRGLKSVNNEVKEELWTEDPHRKTTADNYLQWSPAIIVFGLNAAGVHGKNNLRDRSILYLMSNLFMNSIVTPLKHITHEQRPDGSDYYSFPSGHTAEAFVSAEFMWQEYKEVSPWLGASGYLLAAATGYLRMYNNKHWLNDIVAGAGVGIASTKLAYWLYPKFQHRLFKDKVSTTMIMPVYKSGSIGLAMFRQF